MERPRHLIDVKGVKELAGIQEGKNGLRLGAATTLSEIVHSDVVEKKYGLVAQAAKQVAVPQIRNVGTVGGNLCQRPRCWYFRGKLFTDCIRKGGGTCYAQAEGSENQYHAIMGGDICAMVYPSDLAPALMALEAKVEIAGPKGRRVVPLEQFYVKPEKNPLRETVLGPQELLVAVDIPAASAGKKGVFLKLRERQAFDFAVMSVAVAVRLQGGKVAESRVVFGGMAPVPLRSVKAEMALKGKTLQEAVGVACAAAVEGAKPLSGNGYKVAVAKGVLEQALNLLA